MVLRHIYSIWGHCDYIYFTVKTDSVNHSKKNCMFWRARALLSARETSEENERAPERLNVFVIVKYNSFVEY